MNSKLNKIKHITVLKNGGELMILFLNFLVMININHISTCS